MFIVTLSQKIPPMFQYITCECCWILKKKGQAFQEENKNLDTTYKKQGWNNAFNSRAPKRKKPVDYFTTCVHVHIISSIVGSVIYRGGAGHMRCGWQHPITTFYISTYVLLAYVGLCNFNDYLSFNDIGKLLPFAFHIS